jgi:ACS family hexuronate transporter-like MFS transporter
MNSKDLQTKMSNVRLVICIMLFLATTVNYLDRQVLSLTWKDFIAPEFHWSDSDYGNVAAVFSIVYAIANIFSGRIIDWLVPNGDIYGLSVSGRQARAYMPFADGPQSKW